MPSLAQIARKVKSWCMLSRNRLCLLDGKIRDKSPIIVLIWFFLQYAPYNYLSGVCSEFFDLSCRSISLKSFSLWCSVFLNFCPCLSFRSFANLKLAFSLQKLLGGKRNSSPSWKSLVAVEENYFNRALTSLIRLQWVMYEGSFQVCDGRWWKEILECQTLKLGDAHRNPQ